MPNASLPSHGGSAPSRRSGLAVAAATTLLVLLCAEVGLRVWFPQIGTLRSLVITTDDERGFVLRRGGQFRFGGVFEPLPQEVIWQTNSWGMRADREIATPAERFRIATFGDSETFGWSLPLADTFQRRMQEIDPRIEVLNFGVPGYNVVNVRDHLQRNVPLVAPDLVIYLVNKNDFNEAVQLTPLSRSYLLLHLRFAWHFTVGKQIRRSQRDSRDRTDMFGREIDRMTRFLEARDTPFVVGFLKWSNATWVWPYPGEAIASATRPAAEGARFSRRLVDLSPLHAGVARLDGHWPASVHAKIATLFCSLIAEGAGGCVPPGRREGAVATLPRSDPLSSPL